MSSELQISLTDDRVFQWPHYIDPSDTQVGILVNYFELFTQNKGETIREMSGHFNAIINVLKNLSKDYSTL